MCPGLPANGLLKDGCKEEQEEEEFIARNSDEEHGDNIWYPSEIELENLKQGEEATGNCAKSLYSA